MSFGTSTANSPFRLRHRGQSRRSPRLNLQREALLDVPSNPSLFFVSASSSFSTISTSSFLLSVPKHCVQPETSCMIYLWHCLRVKQGFCRHSDPHQSRVRCHSRTTQTIRWTPTSTPSTTTRSPSTAGQPCLRTLAQ